MFWCVFWAAAFDAGFSEIPVSAGAFFLGALPNFLDSPYTQVMPPAAHRPHRGCVLSQRTLAAPQASQDDRSLGGRRLAPLAFVDGPETAECVLEVGMVTGDGVAEGVDGPRGEFIVRKRLKECHRGEGRSGPQSLFCGEQRPREDMDGSQVISRSRGFSKGKKMMLRAWGPPRVKAGRYLYLARARHGWTESDKAPTRNALMAAWSFFDRP